MSWTRFGISYHDLLDMTPGEVGEVDSFLEREHLAALANGG